MKIICICSTIQSGCLQQNLNDCYIIEEIHYKQFCFQRKWSLKDDFHVVRNVVYIYIHLECYSTQTAIVEDDAFYSNTVCCIDETFYVVSFACTCKTWKNDNNRRIGGTMLFGPIQCHLPTIRKGENFPVKLLEITKYQNVQ